MADFEQETRLENNNSRDEKPPAIPRELTLLPVTETVVFPYMVAPLTVTAEKTINIVNEVLIKEKMLCLCLQKNLDIEDPGIRDLNEICTVVGFVKMLRMPDGTMRLLVQGMARVRIEQFIQTMPKFFVRIKEIEEPRGSSKRIQAMHKNLLSQFSKYLNLVPNVPEELGITAMNIDDPGKLSDFVATVINVKVQDRQEVLESLDLTKRLELVTRLLSRELEMLEIGSQIQSQVKGELDKSQKEYYLRQQLKAIQKELGEDDEHVMEVNELKEKIAAAGMPKQALDAAEKELDRLAKMQPAAAEYQMVRTYLDWLVSLPWSVLTEDNYEIRDSERILNKDHYDLEKPKDRILEYLSVKKLKDNMHGPILCFVGPPGVGKTSLGQSIARAMGRKFVRISLGGVHDEAEIRGHRRTYIGALPGRIIQGIKRAGTRNPVYMLDEIDKVGADFRGDPSSALLEVLDPEQNFAFADHYLDVDFDLSQVMFITTANILDTIPPALRDRMEVIELPGYTDQEKLFIARKYLIPKAINENGLKKTQVGFTTDSVRKLIEEYTREAGVRNLGREIANCCRKAARSIVENKVREVKIDPDMVEEYLGPRKFEREPAERKGEAGVATGLAWTPAGGEILVIESAAVPGNKQLILTGQLGDVMQESARAALTCVRTRARNLDIPPDFFSKYDIHIHVPAGAIPKDGPSAGVTMTMSMISMMTGRPIKSDTAMTGEITLRGHVLPVGGIKEKVLGAHRAGIKTVVLPKRNEKDLADVPGNIRKKMKFIPVENIDQVIGKILE